MYIQTKALMAEVSFVDEVQLKDRRSNFSASDDMVFLIPPYNKSSLLRNMFAEYRNYQIHKLENPTEVMIRRNYKGENFCVFEGYDELKKYL